jgi:RimJ/RimL family protein N-acetyltransferase
MSTANDTPSLRMIVWPSYLPQPLLWAVSDGAYWAGGQFPDTGIEALPGEALGGFSFARWHGALTDSMHWGYHPDEPPPRHWRRALACEVHDVIDAGRVTGYPPSA